MDQSLAAAFDVDVIGGLSRLAGSALGGSAGEKAEEKNKPYLFSQIYIYIFFRAGPGGHQKILLPRLCVAQKCADGMQERERVELPRRRVEHTHTHIPSL